MENYDYILIGGGPTSLTLAYYLSKYNNKILLIEQQSIIGGVHRVDRTHNNMFSDHSPRIYLNNYFSLIDILSNMGLQFDDLFTKYNFSINSSIQENISKFTYKEILAIICEFIKFCIDDNPSKKVTMIEFVRSYNFSDSTIAFLDSLCRSIDGGSIDNFTKWEFFQTINQNFFYSVYEPKLCNDVSLFKHWEKALLDTGNVTIMLNTEVTKINSTDRVNNITIQNKSTLSTISAKNYIFCVPPTPMLKILQNSDNKNILGDINKFVKFEKASRYLIYIPVTFHWNYIVKNIKKKWGGALITDYDIVYIVMSDYMDFQDDRSKTVICCAAKALDRKSKYNNKTANECNEQELIVEVFRQLNGQQPDLPEPTTSILSAGVYKDKNNEWNNTDAAFFNSVIGGCSNKSIYNNLFFCGVQNMLSEYNFTSFESAIENAIALLHELEPKTINTVLIHKPVTIKNVLIIMLIIVVLVLAYLMT